MSRQDLLLIAIEPSATMLAQRRRDAAPAIRGSAQTLPLLDHSVDAALAISTLNHWRSLSEGLAEMRRVSRRRVVMFMRDPAAGTPFWLTQRYFPDLDETAVFAVIRGRIEAEFANVRPIAVPLPADCTDGFLSAFWARPEAYLDPRVRVNMSPFALAAERGVASGLERLTRDLEDGSWDRAYGHLRATPELDLGHRIFVAELHAR